MATLANGTELHKLDSTGASITHTYTDVTNIGEFGPERDAIEYDALDYDIVKALPGKPKYVDLNLEMVCTPEAHLALEQDFDSGAINKYAITFPFEETEGNLDKQFDGFVLSCKVTGIEPDGLLKTTATIRVTSKPTPFTKPTTGGEE